MRKTLLLFFVLSFNAQAQTAKEYFNYGVMKYSTQDYYGAIIEFSKAINIQPDYSEAYANRALAFLYGGDTIKALSDCYVSIQFNKNIHTVYNIRATVHVELQLYDAAIMDTDKAIEMNPDFAEAYYTKGRALYGKGLLKEACEMWYKAADLGFVEESYKLINLKCR